MIVQSNKNRLNQGRSLNRNSATANDLQHTAGVQILYGVVCIRVIIIWDMLVVQPPSDIVGCRELTVCF